MFILFFMLALLICGGYVYARYIEPSRLTVVTEQIVRSDLPDEMDGLKIGFFSDTHISNYFPPETVFRNVIETMQKQKPDIIFFAGDLFDNMVNFEGDKSVVTELLASLEAPYGKYAVYGNHDYQAGTYYQYRKMLEEAGFVFLKNEIEVLDMLKCNIIGLDESLLGYGTMTVTKKVENDYFNIVLSHEPDVIEEAECNVDLLFSGHTHGGQCKIPLLGPVLLPQLGRVYVEGLYDVTIGDGSAATVCVTSGIGMSKLPLRFLVAPEIMVVTLLQK